MLSPKSAAQAGFAHDNGDDTTQNTLTPKASVETRRSSIWDRRRSSVLNQSSQRSRSIANSDATLLVAEALEIQQQHDLSASDNNRRSSIRPEALATAIYSRSRRTQSVSAGDASLLIAEALKKHQEGKDLFRSASKRRESAAAGGPLPPLFAETNHLGTLTSTLPSWTEEEASSSSEHSSPAALDPAPIPPQTPQRIGTALETWTRFPSHTRSERTLSAGPSDDIIVRDFAHLARRNANAHKQKRSKTEFLKHSSQHIGALARYYGTLLTSPGNYRGHGRRTSVSVSRGKLWQPELEMVAIGGSEREDRGQQKREIFRGLRELEEEDERFEAEGEMGKRQDSGFGHIPGAMAFGQENFWGRERGLGEEDEEQPP